MVGHQRRDRGGQLDGRVVGVRHRGVAGRPGRSDARPDDPLLGDLDRVEAAIADGDRVPADLVERGRRSPALRVVEELGTPLDEPASAVLATGLLVRDRGEDDVAPQLRPGRPQGQHDRQLHGHHVLHVDRAAAPHHAVDQITPEWIARPRLGVDRHDVEVAQQDQRRLGGRAGGAQAPEARSTPGTSSITSASMPASPSTSAQ